MGKVKSRPKNKEELPDAPIKRKKRINSKDKGDAYEQWLAKFFRDHLGYQYCKTSRNSSKLTDDCKIDLTGIPYNVQAKSGYWKVRPRPDGVFKEMKDLLLKNFEPNDPIHNKPRILFHKLDGYKDEHHLVTMTFSDFAMIIKGYEENRKNISQNK